MRCKIPRINRFDSGDEMYERKMRLCYLYNYFKSDSIFEKIGIINIIIIKHI